MQPDFAIKVDGSRDATAAIRERFLSLEVTDNAGLEADTARFSVEGASRGIVLPPRGRRLDISMGWQGSLVPMGSFTVDETELSHPPTVLAVTARSADFRAGMKERRTRSWDSTTLGDVVAAIASEHGLRARVAKSLAAVRVQHLDQAEESDLHLLTRLASEHGAAWQRRDGFLALAVPGTGESASGRRLEPLRIREGQAAGWRFRIADRGRYSAVRAQWRSTTDARTESETAGSGRPVYVLRGLYSTQSEAREAAQGRLAELRRGTAEMTLRLHPGKPSASAGRPLELEGFPAGIDGRWIAMRCTHRIDSSGYSTRVIAARLKSP